MITMPASNYLQRYADEPANRRNWGSQGELAETFGQVREAQIWLRPPWFRAPNTWPTGPSSARGREVSWLASSYGLPVGGPLAKARNEREFFGGLEAGFITIFLGGSQELADRAVAQTIRVIRDLGLR